MAATMAQAQGMAGIGIYLQLDVGSHGQLMPARQRVHHHEGPALGPPFDRDILIHEQLAVRADGAHAAGAHAGFATIPANPAHIARLIGPEMALGMEGGQVGDQQGRLAGLAIDYPGLLLVMAQHEAGSAMFHGWLPRIANEERAAAYAKAGTGSLTWVNEPV
ncbi:hypothetical protein D3C76_1110940 [compost metagenome]